MKLYNASPIGDRSLPSQHGRRRLCKSGRKKFKGLEPPYFLISLAATQAAESTWQKEPRPRLTTRAVPIVPGRQRCSLRWGVCVRVCVRSGDGTGGFGAGRHEAPDVSESEDSPQGTRLNSFMLQVGKLRPGGGAWGSPRPRPLSRCGQFSPCPDVKREARIDPGARRALQVLPARSPLS